MDIDEILIIKQLSALFWCIFFVFWFVNYRFLNPYYVKPVHFIWTFVLFFKAFSCSFIYLMLAVDKESIIVQYFSLGFSSSSTLCHTLLYTVILLMSKGLNLTRNSLEKEEIRNISLIMGMNYLSFSLYSIDQINLNIILVIILLVSWLMTYKSTVLTIRILANRLNIMVHSNITQMVGILTTKIRMMSFFKYLANFLYTVTVLYNCLLISINWFGLTLDKYCLISTEAFYEVSFCLTVSVICLIFLPRNRGMFFDLENPEQESDVIPMYEGSLNVKVDIDNDRPFVLINPKEDGINNSPYHNICMALPMKVDFKRGEGLSEPLLRGRR